MRFLTTRATRLALATTLLAGLATAHGQTAVSPAGRLLASNCFQCHGTNGRGPGFEKLAGKSANELYKDMKEFQSGKEGQGIMARHVMGYTDAQLRQLAQWLSTQR
jgi:cytochrome subunit of sulfide dehydrogenase